jgi:NAD(P)-dependent dehydrogenase (short-subunit alcohol dehydrogenase family)
MAVAIVTGGSRGLGEALAGALAERGWSVVVDARSGAELEEAVERLRARAARATRAGGTGRARGASQAGAPDHAEAAGSIVGIAGDVTDAAHRRALVAAAEAAGGIDLLVNNASTLGATPLPGLGSYPLDVLREVYEVNTIAPLALVQAALPLLRRSQNPRVLNVTSDAAADAYEGWGGYGSSKAALEHVGSVVAVEEPWLRVWTVDPGDMRTRMHQDAFPGEDISDRPLPESVVPALIALIDGDRPPGRYRAGDLVPASAAGSKPPAGSAPPATSAPSEEEARIR